MKRAKKPVAFRLSEKTINQLEALAKRYGVSHAQVVTILIHHYSTGADMDALDNWFDLAGLV